MTNTFERELPPGFTMDPTEYLKTFENTVGIKPYPGSIYHKEVPFGGGRKEMIWVAAANHDLKTIRPCHGYFPAHPTGIKMKKFAQQIDYEFRG